MLRPDRIKDRMAQAGLTQSELGRRVGVTQATIYKMVSGTTYGSRHLHRIARELGTTPAYLTGEIDDPDEGAPPPAPPAAPIVMMAVAFPPEPAMAQMFEGLLMSIDREAPLAEQAQLLAQRLPTAMSQLRELRVAPPTLPRVAAPAAPEAAAKRHREQTR